MQIYLQKMCDSSKNVIVSKVLICLQMLKIQKAQIRTKLNAKLT